ncbi:MAG: MFS transporter [Chloroflexi bacterium]|nr:MFS transporter [Chloroflexota bacterium]
MTAKAKSGSFYGWWLLPILCLVYSIPIGFALYGPPVIYTYMSKALGWERGQINLGYTIIGIMLGMGAFFIPFLINRFGPRKTLAIGAVLTAISGLLVAFFGQVYPVYLLLCFFVGLGLSFGTVLPVQTLVLYWFNVHRALAMGLVLGGGAIGGFIYPQIVSACIINFGGDWRVGWYVIAITCFIGAIIAMIAVRNRPEDLGQHPDGLSPEQEREAMLHARHKPIKTYRSPVNWQFRNAVSTPSLWMIVVATGFIYFLWQAVLTQTAFHLRDQGFSPADPVIFLRPEFVYGTILACSIIGRLSVSFLGERIESRFLISIAGFSLVIGGALFLLASKDNMWAVYLFPLFTGFGFGATYVSVPLITGNYFGARAFPSISTITNPVGSIFQFSSPFIAGWMYDVNGNYNLAILIGCSGALVGAIVILFCRPPHPRQDAINS